MFSRPKILFLVSLLFVALLNPNFNPYLLFKFLIFYHSSNIGLVDICVTVYRELPSSQRLLALVSLYMLIAGLRYVSHFITH